jgi:hypothetical protein
MVESFAVYLVGFVWEFLDFASFFFQKDGNTIADRVGQSVRTASQLLVFPVIFQRSFADRADEDIK